MDEVKSRICKLRVRRRGEEERRRAGEQESRRAGEQEQEEKGGGKRTQRDNTGERKRKVE